MMWLTTLGFAAFVLYQLQIIDCVPSQTLVATVEPQTLVINLTLDSHHWYITTQNPADSINITVTDVKIGTGYSGLVEKCQTDFVRISDTKQSTNRGISICGGIIKEEWKGWESSSNNVSILYSTHSYGRFNFYVSIEYSLIRHFCRYKPPPCNNGTCIETNNNDGYSCTCVVGFTGDKCDQQVEFIEATSQPRNITTDKTAKALWIITAEQNQVINIELSVVENVGSSLSSSNILDYIKINDTKNEERSKTFSLLELRHGISWLSQGTNVTIKCDYNQVRFSIVYKARPVIQVIEATTKLRRVRVNSTSNKKFQFIAKDDYYINISLSIVKNHTSLQIDGNKPDYIKIYDTNNNGSVKYVSIKELLDGITWSSQSTKVAIECDYQYGDPEVGIEYKEVQHMCSTSPCKNGGKCANDINSGFNCTCKSGFEGTQCDSIIGTYCPGENYTVPFTGYIFSWKDTPTGSDDMLPCPLDYFGSASRFCMTSNSSEHGGKWTKPNLTECVSKEIQKIHDETNTLLGLESIDSTIISNLTSRLTAATSKSKTKKLYPGDVTTATRTVHTLANIVKSTRADSNELSSIAQGYGEAVGNIVDPSLTDVWTFTSEDIVQSHMLSILSSVELLSGNVAKKKVSYLHRKRREISRYTANETVYVHANNLEFHISFHEKIAICDESYNIKLGDDTSSAVTLTSAVFKAAIENTGDRYIQVYNARFSTIANIIDASKSTSELESATRRKVTPYVNSDILSSGILNIPEDKFQNLKQPVVIMLEMKNKSTNWDLREKCVYVNMSSSDHNIWANEGCKLDYHLSNSTHMACKCTHLTNFAVLMDVFQVQDDIDYIDYTILTYITYIGGVMSTLACIITVIVFQCFSLRKERVLVHQQLAISIILVQVFFLVGIDRTENKYVCTVMAAMLHYSVISMFCWMLIEGFHLYVMLVKVFRRKANFRKYLLFGWGYTIFEAMKRINCSKLGIPLVVVGISLGVFHDQYGGPARCWLSHNILLMAFVPVVGLVIVINTVVLIVVLRIMMKSMLSRANSEERSAIKAGLKAAAILLPLLGITWTLGFFSINKRDTLIFTYLFTFFNSLQGVFFFVFHCLLNTDVKNAFERRSQRRSMIKLLTESLGNDSRTRKSSTLNTALTSKSSINSILSEEFASGKKKCKNSNNDIDRIHRDHMTDIYDKQYHHNLHRSFSDGIPRWQNVNKEFQFYTGKDNVNILGGHRFHTGKKFQENNGRISSDGKEQLESTTDTHAKDFRIEDLYSKPTRRRVSSSDEKEPIHKDNRVRFEENGDIKRTQETIEDQLKGELLKELTERNSSYQT